MRRITCAVLLALVALGSAAAAAAAEERTRNHAVPSPLRAATLDNEVGRVEVRRGAQARLSITERWTAQPPTVDVRRNGDALIVVARCPDIQAGRCSVDVVLTVVDALALTADVGVGDVDVDGMAGSVVIDVGVGGIEAVDLAVTRVAADNGTGHVLVDVVTAPDEVVARSGAGDVEVTVPAGAYDVDVDAETGDAAVRGIQNDPGAPRRITATSDVGDVTVRARGSASTDGSRQAASRAERRQERRADAAARDVAASGRTAVAGSDGAGGRDGDDGEDGAGGAALGGFAIVVLIAAGAWITRTARLRGRRD